MVEAESNRLEKEGIIEKVEKPTDWCATMVHVLKKNENVRIRVDLKKLNEAVKREHFMHPNIDDISPRLAGSASFSKLETSSGFCKIPLHPDNCELTTFITRYDVTTLDEYHLELHPSQKSSSARGLIYCVELREWKLSLTTSLFTKKKRREPDRRLDTVLRRIHDSGLILNRGKCEFRKIQIEYFGHSISFEGI